MDFGGVTSSPASSDVPADLARDGRIELERRVDSIKVGARHRSDPERDLAPLMRSIQRLGLLQPITIAPDGVLICGLRRLEAIKQLGWQTVRVWVRTGISDDLSMLLAEHDENALHSPLSPLDAARLYRELKQLLTEDAARRQYASRFGSTGGGPDSAPPLAPQGKSALQAALLVTDRASHTRLEQISAIEAIAAAPDASPALKGVADELERIQQDGPVDPGYQRVRALQRTKASQRASPDVDELEAMAANALARVKAEQAERVRANRRKREKAAQPSCRSVRSFVLLWSDLSGWTQRYDAGEIGRELSDADWAAFERTLRESVEFADAARRARETRGL